MKSLSRVWLFATLWTVACWAPPSMGFFQARILGWVAISFSRGYSRPGNMHLPHCRQTLYCLSHQESQDPKDPLLDPIEDPLFVVVQSLKRVQLFVSPWTAAWQTSLSFIISWSLLKLMSFESVMPSNHLIPCHPLLLPPSIFPSIRVFFNELALRIR